MKAKSSIIGFTAIVFTTAWTAPSPNVLQDESTPVTVTSQIEDDISFVRVHRQGKSGVTTTWGVGTSQGVVGYLLQKTYEDPNDEYALWEDVTSVPNTGARSYKYTDTNVFPGHIKYRVVALKANGSSVTSAIATAHIVSH